VRNPLKQFRRGATVIAATSLLLAITAVVPAQAVNKAGAACKKANAKMKIGGDSYVCIKNPTVKNAKLTWVWTGCVDSNKLYIESSARLKTINETAAQAVKLLDIEIIALKAAAPSYEAEAKAFDQKAADAKVKQAAALLDAKANADNATRVGVTTTAPPQLMPLFGLKLQETMNLLPRTLKDQRPAFAKKLMRLVKRRNKK